MRNKINKNSLFLLPLFFVFIALFRTIYAYHDITQEEEEFSNKQGDLLTSLMLANGSFYQDLFIEEHIPLDAKSAASLPAYSSTFVSELFAEHDDMDIEIKAVSDRARNPKNKADQDELRAIEHFKKDSNATVLFSRSEDAYHYAYALRIDERCLKCHGKREEAPAYISQHYDKAYDYALGETRGVISIKMPKGEIHEFLFSRLMYSVFYDLFLLFILFAMVFVLMRKFSEMNVMLETEVQKKTEELQKMLATHPLTGLPNRNRLLNTLEASEGPAHLALLNIDSFKEINDFYGHRIADKLLIAIALSIQSRCSASMHLFKMPADEYAIFTDQRISHSDFVKSIKLLLGHLSTERFLIDTIEVNVTFGCGIAFGSESLLIKADIALQKAKSDKRSLVVYSAEIDIADKTDQNINAIAILKKAIEEDRIVPYFQPIFNLHTNKIEKYESLARVVESDGTVLSPYMFLEVAERSKLYPYITKAMIEKSFALFRKNGYAFSINLSIRDVVNTGTVNYIREQLAAFPGCERIVFEILEGDKIENYTELKTFIEMVKAYGVKIAIDDFGSGYSNFSHIMELDVDYLKIDASLIRDITTSVNSQIIVQGIVDFSRRLGLKTIAEYVESKEIMEMLLSMDLDYVQGYHIGRPSPELQIIKGN